MKVINLVTTSSIGQYIVRNDDEADHTYKIVTDALNAYKSFSNQQSEFVEVKIESASLSIKLCEVISISCGTYDEWEATSLVKARLEGKIRKVLIEESKSDARPD